MGTRRKTSTPSPWNWNRLPTGGCFRSWPFAFPLPRPCTSGGFSADLPPSMHTRPTGACSRGRIVGRRFHSWTARVTTETGVTRVVKVTLHRSLALDSETRQSTSTDVPPTCHETWFLTARSPFVMRICAFEPPSTNVLHRDGRRSRPWRADVAQLVAHHLAKVRVAGSNPVIRSKVRKASTPAVEWPSGEATACKAVHTGSIPVSTSKVRPARLAQRESASLTRKRSLVQSQYRAPRFTAAQARFSNRAFPVVCGMIAELQTGRPT